MFVVVVVVVVLMNFYLMASSILRTGYCTADIKVLIRQWPHNSTLIVPTIAVDVIVQSSMM